MPLSRDITLALAALAAAFFGMMEYGAHAGDWAQALLPLTALLLVYSVPHLLKLPMFTVVTGFTFMMTFLDEPHNFAFNEANPISKVLGPLLFERLRELLGMPGLKITAFEVFTLVLVLCCALRVHRPELKAWFASRNYRTLLLMALVVPVTAGFALAYGAFRGYDVAMGLTQVRFLPVMGLWLYLGYASYDKPEQIDLLFKTVLVATVLKCLEGWWVFFVDYGLVLGTREYLLEHITSEFIAVCLFFVAYIWWHQRRHRLDDVLAAGLIVLMLVPYVLNLRRTSFLGVGFTALLLPVFYLRQVRKRHIIAAALALGLVGAVLAATWNLPPPLGSLSYPLKRFVAAGPAEELDYRDVENYDHYRSIMVEPLLGRGFGEKLVMFLPLVDITSIYALADIVPHNNILFLWCNAGPLGIAALAAVVAFGFAVCLRLNRVATDARVRLLGFLGWGMVLRWLIYAYADLGLAFFRLPAFLGLVLGMAIKALGQEAKGGAYAQE